MKNTKNILFAHKNSQRGASVLEVIFAIGLVVAVTPFIYSQVSEMTHVVHDVSVANKIKDNRDAVLTFMRMNQSDFEDGSNEIPGSVLETIAPDAIKGMVFQTSIDNNIKNIETYLLFNFDDTKYRVSSVVKYIGPDAAVVGDDNRAYAKDWAVQLPDSWSDVLESGDNHLVYRITRDFGGDDKTLYLHRSNLGDDHLNRMERDLHMNNNDLVNVADFNVNNALEMYSVRADSITATERVYAPVIQFSQGAIMNNGTLTVANNITGTTAAGFEGGLNVNQLCANSGLDAPRCNLKFENIQSNSFILNDTDGLVAPSEGSYAHVRGFTLTDNLFSPNIIVDEIQTAQGLALVVSYELRHDALLKLGEWGYSLATIRTDGVIAPIMPVGPKLVSAKVDADGVDNGKLENNKNYDPYSGSNKISVNWDCVLRGVCMAAGVNNCFPCN